MKNRFIYIVTIFAMLFTASLTAQNLMQGKRIFLDPGHDGFGSGDRNLATINFPTETSTGLGNGGFYESKFNVVRGLEVQRLLQGQGATVGITRTTTPQPVELMTRRDLANAFNADAYISIHSNANGDMVNHPLALWDDRSNPIHPQTQQLALSMVWWLATNPLTSWSTNSNTNARAQALGAIYTNQMPAALTEDTFHDYKPETHRYLSPAYNHMIAFSLYRGFLRFFGINPNTHPTGIIAGWVKDDTRSITNNFPTNGSRYLPFRPGSHDAYWPINGATVELLQGGSVIDTYTTDNNWNGVYGFFDLAPGAYQVRISAAGYATVTRDVTVNAGDVAAANQIMSLCDPNDPNCVQLFPPLRLVIGTEPTAPFGTHVTTADLETTTRLYLGIDQNNNASNPSWIAASTTTLTSSDRDVAVVDVNGVIELRRAGEVLIRAVRGSDGASGEITLTVTGSDPFCNDFKDPPSDGSFGLAASYEFEQVGTTAAIDPLAGLTVRRSILRDGKLYVLAAERADVPDNRFTNPWLPRLFVINPETGALIKEMSTAGIEGYNPTGTNLELRNLYPLSDIAFTADGVLIGTNSTVTGVDGNQFAAGDFIVYKWQATETVALEDVAPVVFLRHQNRQATAVIGNNNSNFVGNSIAVTGCIDDMRLYFTSHPGTTWGGQMADGTGTIANDGNFTLLHMLWIIEDGVRVEHSRDNTGWMSGDAGARTLQLTLSPPGFNCYVISGSHLRPHEVQFNPEPWVTGTDHPRGALTPFSGDIPTGSTGATYFRYAGRDLMVSPILDGGDVKARLFDITDGFGKAKMLGETPVAMTGVSVGTRMFAAGRVDNAEIYIYLMVGNQIAKYEVSDFTSATTRIFAYNLVSEYNDEGGYDISFDLNYDANSVELILTNVETKAETVIPLGSLAQGNHQKALLNTQIPATGTFNWSIRASADPIARLTQIDTHNFTRPRTVAIDNSPESPYFGRVYVGNSNHADTPAGQLGIFVLSPTGEDTTEQGNVAYAGTGMGWAAAAVEQNFRKLAVAEDGRVFIADYSIANSGIYIMNPSTFEMSQMFTTARDADGRFGGITLETYFGGRTSGIGVRGGGANTQVYALFNHPDLANTWTQVTHVYNIGTGSTWSGVPSWRRSGTAANANISIAPVAEGHWVGQFRGAGSNTSPNPSMYFFSSERNAVTFNSGEPTHFDFTWPNVASEAGALAVCEPERLVALVLDGHVQFFSYEFPPFSEGVPTVKMLYKHNLGGVHVDFEFDYAGNLYTVSAATGAVRTWAMPTSDNTKVTPARKSMLIARGGDILIEYQRAICEGSSYSDEYFEGLTEADIYETTLPNGTVVRLTLTINPTELHEYEVVITVEEIPYSDENFTNLTTAGIHERTDLKTIHGCDSIIRLNLVINVSLKNINMENSVHVYPNPVENVVHIECGFEIETIKLFDLTGRTVMNISVNEKQKTVDLSGINSGTYILYVNNIPVKVIKK